MSVSSENLAAASVAPRPESKGSAGARGREATRARLLESARLLFGQHGLHGVTTHDIAHHAQVAAGTFYLHFKNKSEVLGEIVDAAVAELINRIETACHPYLAEGDMLRFVSAQAEAMVSFAEDHREIIRIVFSTDSDAAAIGSNVLSLLATEIETGRRELMQAGAAPSDVDPAVLGQAVVGMWARVLSWWSEDPTRVTREVLIETLTRIQLSGTHPI